MFSTDFMIRANNRTLKQAKDVLTSHFPSEQQGGVLGYHVYRYDGRLLAYRTNNQLSIKHFQTFANG